MSNWSHTRRLLTIGIRENRNHEQKAAHRSLFVLDTTGSMGGLIEGAKQKIWSIANEMISAKPTPELKLGLIGYRDRGDEYVLNRFSSRTTSIRSMAICATSKQKAVATHRKA